MSDYDGKIACPQSLSHLSTHLILILSLPLHCWKVEPKKEPHEQWVMC